MTNKIITLKNHEAFLNFTDARVDSCLADEQLTAEQKLISISHQIDNYKLIIKELVEEAIEKETENGE